MESFQITIDSRDRLTGTDAQFYFQVLFPSYTEKYDRVALCQATVPRSLYNIEEGYNSFTLTEDGMDSLVTIDAGIYSMTTLGQALTAEMTAASTIATQTYTVVGSMVTGRYTFTAGHTNHTISLTFEYPNSTTQLYGGIAETLGFLNSTYSFTSGVLTAPNFMNLSSESSIYLRTNLVPTGILGVIYTQGNQIGSYALYNNPDLVLNSFPYQQSPMTNSYSMTITDENNTPINLQGLNWSFQLLFFKDYARYDNVLLGKIYNELLMSNNFLIAQGALNKAKDDIKEITKQEGKGKKVIKRVYYSADELDKI